MTQKQQSKKSKTDRLFILCDGDSIYGVSIYLFIGTYAKYSKYIQKEYNIAPEDQKFFGASFQTIYHESGKMECGIIWMPLFKQSFSNWMTLSHECLHAAMKILEKCSVKISFSNHESLAYLQEHLLSTAWNKLTENKRNNRNTK
ncbi:MAG: hypothetical protein WCI51_07230 [Lentisphaerota bacterium]